MVQTDQYCVYCGKRVYVRSDRDVVRGYRKLTHAYGEDECFNNKPGSTFASLTAASDPVERPAHYTFGKYEVLDVIADWDLNFSRGSALKYLARAGRKSKDTEAQDLRKAAYLLSREADRIERENG